ncbi:2-dehydro-3-deoxygalactonokinase [Paracoccus sp. DMF]|uniref:2-dehydro-3-deoxygalactonokinase n=1 Tax=Paracoccus sp. DMF TaxID=400837 RepID=UPI0021E48CA8|nr:2-dehydro-3-deoxygalactonokinase [Paracoccus sp. DMF]MCV2445712.1 2-dehydro-3-deoxygalactonokinase [Paracoccus sp. DMF]
MAIHSTPRFAAVDWGTSSFRAWLVDAAGRVLAERRSAQGMTVARETGFREILDGHLAAMQAPEGLGTVICGMAGARQGWVEAGYLDCPAALDDLATRAIRVAHPARDIRILPGVAQRDADHPDVIRGEETQLLGLARDDEALTVVMPGTHSKWVRLQGTVLAGFSTHMTGEIFQALTSATLLKHAVEGAQGRRVHAAFRAGVAETFAAPAGWSSRLFEVRGRQLLFGADADAARDRISGILIGAEIAAGLAQGTGGSPVRILASGRLADLYIEAFELLGIAFAVEDADRAVLAGLTLAAGRIWP